jgi:heat shock protein HtpX
VSHEVAANKRRAALLLAGLVAVVGLVGLLVGLVLGHPWWGLLAGLVVGVGLAVAAELTAQRMAVTATGGQLADPTKHARLVNLVAGLCVAAGLPEPRLYVVDEPAPNAMSAGRGSRHGSVVVTSGLLDVLDRVELEGVVAHELSHLRDGSAGPATLAVPVLGFLLPLSAPLLQALCGPWREHHADAAAVQLTRYPPGLASALEKVAADQRPTRAARKRVAHLWLKAPGASLDERIAVLREL